MLGVLPVRLNRPSAHHGDLRPGQEARLGEMADLYPMGRVGGYQLEWILPVHPDGYPRHGGLGHVALVVDVGGLATLLLNRQCQETHL